MEAKTTATPPQGYEVARLVGVAEDLVEDLLCGLCKRIVVHGEMCKACIGPFCGSCIASYISQSGGRCPQGCKYQTMELLPVYKKLLKKLRLRCKNAPNKCEEILPYDSVDEHERLCGFELTGCTVPGCDARMLRKELAEHMAVCKFLIVDCRYCAKKFSLAELAVHEETCDDRPIKCPSDGCCFASPKKDYATRHQGKCPYELLECKWCKTKKRRNELQAHQDGCDYRLCKCRGCSQDFCKKSLGEHEAACESVKVACERCRCVMRRGEKKAHDCVDYLSRTTERLEKLISSLMCEACLAKKPCCETCKKSLCVRCEAEECEGCRATVCRDCAVRCKECRRLNCRKCVEATCNVCNKSRCKKCSAAKFCAACDKLPCGVCAKRQCAAEEKTNAKCAGCGKEFPVETFQERGCSCIECKELFCSACTFTKARMCRKCALGREGARYCVSCYNKTEICRRCNKKVRAGEKWDNFVKGREIVTDIPVAYSGTHDGGATMDAGRGFIWSIHGYSNDSSKGLTLYKLNLATKKKESFKLPFNTHGSYPLFDGNEYVYVNSSEELAGNNQLARVNVETGKLEKLKSAPANFQEYTNGVFRNGILYKINESNYLMKYDPKTDTWTNNVFSVGCLANMLADVRNEDGIFLMRENSDLQLYSVSRNTIEMTFAAHGKYCLGTNANCEIVLDEDDYENCFICCVGDNAKNPPKAINIKRNVWVPLPWTIDKASGGFLIYDGTRLWNSVNTEGYWRQIVFN